MSTNLTMLNNPIKLAIVGVGKIVRDQHIPALNSNSRFSLSATASRNASIDGIPAFKDITSLLDRQTNNLEIDAIALCMPPKYRYEAARIALKNGKHVLMEKPPGATVSEVEHLQALARSNGVTLFATWHSRYGSAVETAKQRLSGQRLISVSVVWKESVRKWHPDQEWIWQAGGLGVFDPGINGLSILSYCLSSPVIVRDAIFTFPSNKASPIAADVSFQTDMGVPIKGCFDWRAGEKEEWSISFETSGGLLELYEGGAKLKHNGESIDVPEQTEFSEYQAIYSNFARLIDAGHSDVDLAPLKLVSDAFLIADRKLSDSFYWS